jgi:mannose-1-phosphate guanylyltransferase
MLPGGGDLPQENGSMRGFILAAGFGTRLRPITDHLPKALVPLAGKPLLAHAVDFLRSHAIAPLAVNTHYLADAIIAFRTSTGESFEVFHETPEIRGTGGALDFARAFLGGDDTFIIINVDIVARFDLTEHISSFLRSNDSCRLLAFPNSSGTGTVRYAAETGDYLGTSADTDCSDNASTADFIGMTLYRREFLSLVGPDDFSILPVWKRAVDRGMKVTVGCIDQGYWRDIGRPESLAQAHFDCIDGVLSIDMPSSQIIDRERKISYPARWQAKEYEFGPYAWIEEPSFDPSLPIERSVVFCGARPVASIGREPVRSTLFTPWGALPFNE